MKKQKSLKIYKYDIVLEYRQSVTDSNRYNPRNKGYNLWNLQNYFGFGI